jgi:extracellular elastinolytic metalloproteinase
MLGHEPADGGKMIKELDTRKYDYQLDKVELQQQFTDLADEISARLPDDQSVSVTGLNQLTGSPERVDLKNIPAVTGSVIEQALNLAIRTVPRVSGFAAADALEAEFVPDPRVLTTSSGSQAVHLSQYYRGIPVFQMSRTVQFSSGQIPRTISGNSLPLGSEIQSMPNIDVVEAARSAHKYINANQDEGVQRDGWGQTVSPRQIRKTRYVPKILVTFDLPSKPTVLNRGPFAEYVAAHLVIFHQGPKTRLGWHFVFSLKEHQGQYRIIVAADDEGPGEILYVRGLTLHVKGQGNVYLHNGDGPRRMVPFPRSLSDYPVQPPASLPVDFPPDWVLQDQSTGNNTHAVPHDEVADKLGDPILGQEVSGVLTFNPSDSTSDEQKVLNIFYYCNYMHDFFYLLGFDEASGNFQRANLSGLGRGGDPVLAIAYPGEVDGTASMGTSVDSRYPVMKMGLVTSSGRHTAFDADVVFHEFAHGVTRRLVGGPMNTWALDAEQSRGMGEGWSDYFALTIHNYVRNVAKTVVGDWVTNSPSGIREYPYDDSFPDGFGKLGTGRYTWRDTPHNIGEIWCAVLMTMTRKIVGKLGRDRGYQICWQIVVDGLKLTPGNPSFLQARDAILQALDDMKTSGSLNSQDHRRARRGAWEAFAHYGMGVLARSDGPIMLDGGANIHEDFTLPIDL